MSRWRALAAAHDVRDADLRSALVDALETLHHVADALRACDDVGDVRPTEQSLLDAIAELDGVHAEAREREEAAEAREDAAEGALQALAERDAEIDNLRERIALLEKQNDALTEEAIARQPMLDAYADLLARARTFVTFAEKHGVKATHCRPVNSNGRKAKRG